MILNELVRQLVAILRYIAAPGVALVLVWLVDDRHDIVKAVAEAAWPWSAPPSPWPLMGVLGLMGVTVYFGHRTLFHPCVTKCLVWWHTRAMTTKPTIDDLAFARWQRRGAADHSPEQSAQSVLDETNAAIHFFYCTGWSSVLIFLLLRAAFPVDFQLAGSTWALILIVAGFFVTGFIGDYRTARLDLEAYRRFGNAMPNTQMEPTRAGS